MLTFGTITGTYTGYTETAFDIIKPFIDRDNKTHGTYWSIHFNEGLLYSRCKPDDPTSTSVYEGKGDLKHHTKQFEINALTDDTKEVKKAEDRLKSSLLTAKVIQKGNNKKAPFTITA